MPHDPSKHTGLMARVTGKIALTCAKHAWVILLLSCLLAMLALIPASTLRVNAQLSQLLPRDSARVRGLNLLEKELGQPSNLVIAIEGAPTETLIQLSDTLAPKLTALEQVSFVQAKHPTDFFIEHALLYTPLQNLERAERALTDTIASEKRANNPLLVQLRPKKRAPLDIESIFDKDLPHASSMALPHGAPESLDDLTALIEKPSHLISKEGDLILLLVYPKDKKLDLKSDRALVSAAQNTLDAHDLKGARVTLGGGVAKRVAQQASVASDMQWVSIVGLCLVLAYLLIYFRKPRSIIITALPLILGVVWAFGVGALAFGELNILTSFVSVMLLGLGLDHGVHLLSRHERERQRRESLDAIEHTFKTSGHGIALAAITTILGFGAVSTSEFRAFREFGILAAVGMATITLAYMTTFPALLHLSSKLGNATPSPTPKPRAISPVTRLTARYPRAILLVAMVISVGALAGIERVRFESSWRALSGGLPAFEVDDMQRRVLGRAQSGVFLIADDAREASALASTLRRQREEGQLPGVHQISTPTDFIPPDQPQKLAILARMRKQLEDIPLERVTKSQRALVQRMILEGAREAITFHTLPTQIRHAFDGEDPRFHERLVLIWSREDLDDGDRARELISHIDGIQIEDHPPRVAIGIQLITADAVDLLAREAPRMSLFVLAAIFLVLLLGTRDVRGAVICTLAAASAVCVGLGALGVLDVALNYFNIALVAVIVGMAVDGAIHVTHRAHAGGASPRELDEVTRANFAALFTTALGFGAMRLADHPGVTSLADLALVGLAASVLIDIIALPALMFWLHPDHDHGEPMEVDAK